MSHLQAENRSRVSRAIEELNVYTQWLHRSDAPVVRNFQHHCENTGTWLNLHSISCLKKLSFDEFHAFVDVALWSPLDADKVLRVSADGAVEQVEPEIEIMGEEKVQRSKRGGTERVPEAGD